jgi:hypothetical protein
MSFASGSPISPIVLRPDELNQTQFNEAASPSDRDRDRYYTDRLALARTGHHVPDYALRKANEDSLSCSTHLEQME